MASKLMGLRDDLDQLIEESADKVLTKDQFMEIPGFDELMDKIVAVARAEGVAEGAEQERERIRNMAVDEHWGSIGEDVRRVCTVPASALAPKETDNG